MLSALPGLLVSVPDVGKVSGASVAQGDDTRSVGA